MISIDSDLGRFRDIVKGRVRKDLRRFMGSDEIRGDRDGKTFTVPVPTINIPRLRYGNNAGGVGQGEGGKGQPVPGAGQPGEGSGEHALEMEVSLEELAAILAEELNLPPLLPKGQQLVPAERTRYTGISSVGPSALRHGRRTWKRALMREISEGTYNSNRPIVIPRKEDMRYRAGVPKHQPQAAACAIYIMDVSGSMGETQKTLARQMSFWINLWLRKNFPRMKSIYIIHDAQAKQVGEHEFFHTSASGGTLISSAYNLLLELMPKECPPDDWNVFVFQFSDGDNWSEADTDRSLELLDGNLLPHLNLFGYAQLDSTYGSGDFYRQLGRHFGREDKVRLAKVAERGDIINAIRQLFG